MKSFFKILILVVSCCYLNTVFELCDDESKANFKNEIHSYIYQDEVNIKGGYTKVVKNHHPEIVLVKENNSLSTKNIDSFDICNVELFSPPKQRKYILYESLLI